MHIDDKKKLKDVLREEKYLYLGQKGKYQGLLRRLKSHPDFFMWKYVKLMRIANYYYCKRRRNIIYSLLYFVNIRKFNKLGRKLGIECGENVFDKGLRIFHSQGIVVNGNAIVGENCRLYGNNCIGNDGIHSECPKIGDNVRLCVGAKVLGNVELADGIVVAAGAVVIKSCNQKNVTLAGVPAKIVSENNQEKKYLD